MYGLVKCISVNNVITPAFIYSKSKKISKTGIKKAALLKAKTAESGINKFKGQPGPYMLYFLSAVLALMYLYTRLITLQVPLSRDEGAYTYFGKLTMSGKIPYRDFYEMKPPLLYYLYGAGSFIFGYSDTGLRLFALFLNLATAILIYKISNKLFNKAASVFAASAYLILLMNVGAFGFAMIAEHLVNLFLAAGFLFLINKDWKYNYFISGLIFGMALMIKQSAVFLTVPAGLYIAHYWWKEKKFFFKPAFSFSLAYLAVIVLVLVSLKIAGALNEAVYWLRTYPSAYASSADSKEATDSFLYSIRKIYSQSPLLIWLFSISFLWNGVNFFRNRKLTEGFLVLLTLFSFFTVSLGLRFYGQYWQLVIPPAAILIASFWNVLEKTELFTGFVIRVITWILTIAIPLDIAGHYEYFKTKDADSIAESAYPGNPFLEIKTLSNILREKILPEEKFFVFGSEPQIYVYTKKNAISKHIYHSFFSKPDPENKIKEEECLSDFTRQKPEYVVYNSFPFSWMFKENSTRFLYSSAFGVLENEYNKILVFDINSQRSFEGDSARNFDLSSGNVIIVYQLKK